MTEQARANTRHTGCVMDGVMALARYHQLRPTLSHCMVADIFPSLYRYINQHAVVDSVSTTDYEGYLLYMRGKITLHERENACTCICIIIWVNE